MTASMGRPATMCATAATACSKAPLTASSGDLPRMPNHAIAAPCSAQPTLVQRSSSASGKAAARNASANPAKHIASVRRSLMRHSAAASTP